MGFGALSCDDGTGVALLRRCDWDLPAAILGLGLLSNVDGTGGTPLLSNDLVGPIKTKGKTGG